MERLASTRPRLLIAGLALLLASCGGNDSESASGTEAKSGKGTIKIGALVPLSGDNTNAGTDMLNAAKLAADDINAGGGVLGQRVEIVPADDGCDPQTGTAAAQKLLVSGIVGVAGGYCSTAAIPETAVLDPKGIPYISAAATNPTLTERGMDTVFRTIGRDDQQGPFAARFLANSIGVKKLALLHNNTVYGKGLAEQTRAANDELKLGMEIVYFDAITQGERDFNSTLTKIKTSGADALYFAGYLGEAGLLIRQAKDLRLALRLTGGDGTQDPAVIKTAGPAAEGYVATTAPLPAFLPAAAGFTKTYTERFGGAPGPYSVYEYDAVRVLADAVARAGSTDHKKVVEALRATRHTGITGEIAFNDKGDRQKALYVTAIVRGGQFVPHKKLDDAGHWVDG
jgi:ABC-type branched-subunit amino acid transport system substrate-binding protein